MVELTQLQTDVAVGLGILLAVIIIPLFFRKIVEPRLLRLYARKQAANSRIIVRQISNVIGFWTLIAGIATVRYVYSGRLDSSLNHSLLVLTKVLVVLGVIWFLNRVTQESLKYYSRKSMLPSTTIFSNLSKLAIFALAVTSIMFVLGFSIAPLLATIGVGGLAIALAMQDTLSSLFAGIYIILSKQINPNDYVRLSTNEEGFIQDINWRNTTIRTRENNMIIVPNRNLANLTITNFSLMSKEMSLHIPVGVHYDTDLELAETLAIEVGIQTLKEIPGGVESFTPLIRYNAFADSAITFNVILRIQEYTSQGLIRHNFIKRLRKKYAEYGITIPYPMRTLTFEDNLQVHSIKVQDTQT